MAALRFAEGRVERRLGGARQPHTRTRPQRRQAVAQTGRDRLARFQSRCAQAMRHSAGQRGEIGEAQLACAVGSAGKLGEGVGDRGKIGGPVDGGKHRPGRALELIAPQPAIDRDDRAGDVVGERRR